MKTMGGNKRKEAPTIETPIMMPSHNTSDIIDVEEEVIDFDMVGDSVDIEMQEEEEEEEEPPQKRHKKHKHKRHKKRKEETDEALIDSVIINTPRVSKPSLKLKIKLAESSEKKQRERERAAAKAAVVKPVATPPAPPAPPVPVPMPSTSTSPASLKLLQQKKKKGGKGKESGTSSEEERWLDAIESGKLEEVDDELKKIKDPKLMTARQRAMFERKTEKEPSPGGEQLLALPSGYKEKVVTEEMLQKRALKLQRRKQMAEEKREKDKKKTMDRLLKKQETKSKTAAKPFRTTRRIVPQMSYFCKVDSTALCFPVGFDFPMAKMEARPVPPPRPVCAVKGCGNVKKYNCSKTGVPLCSFECYKLNLQSVRSV